MIGIVDYGMGNLLSVYHAVEAAGGEPKILHEPREARTAERLILPGVGAFPDCIENLRRSGFADALHEEVMDRRKPILGICLGMQAMARRGYEGGEHEGLGWIEADVVRLEPHEKGLRVPQIGWNEIEPREGSPLFRGLPTRPTFYFVHSYHVRPRDPSIVEATADYGGTVTAALRKENIAATQFHPEKSQDHGQAVLKNFLAWRP